MSHARGQVLVLLALSLLVLCVGLAMTIAIGHRAKERVELQTLTDAAAYSTAAATARSFNAFATLNRAAVSHWVALSGTEALIAWSGPTADPSLANAHEQARDIHDSVGRIEVLEEKIYEDLIFEVIEDQRYMRAAAALGEGNADPGRGTSYLPPSGNGTYAGSQTACREVCHAVNDADLDLQDHDDLDLAEVAQAVQGSRGHAFTVVGTATEAVHTYIRDETSPAALYARLDDDSYVDADWVVPTYWYRPDTTNAYSVDVPRWQSISAVSYPMPPAGTWAANPALGAGSAAVISTPQDDNTARFGAWTAPNSVPFAPDARLGPRSNYWQDLPGDTAPLRLTHAVPKHPGLFRGGFGFVDGLRYRAGRSGPGRTSPEMKGPRDLFGQPKLAMMLWRWRDPSSPPSYPWELVFRLKFSQSGPGSEINMKRSKRMEMGTDSFLFHTMGALASGLAYYHRPGHLREPANLLNPYWRATLVPTDLDENGESLMAALPHVNEFGDAEHEEHWLQGWRPGDVGMLTKNGSPRSFPELTILEYRLINEGGFTAVP